MDYMLLDLGASAKVLKKAPLKEIQLHARLVLADNPLAILTAPPVEGRSFAKLNHHQLIHILYSLGATPAEDYAACCGQALGLVEAMACDTTPLERLEKEVSRRGAPTPDLNTPALSSAPKAAVAPKPQREPSEATRPKEGSATGIVWAMADELRASLGRLPTSKEVVTACEPRGVKAGTVSVQYGKWKQTQN